MSEFTPISATTPKMPGSPDIEEVEQDGWPSREPKLAAGCTREKRFQAVVRQSVLDAIHGHGKSITSVEVCGVLVGTVYQDANGPYLHVNSSIRGDRATGYAAQVTFTAETWSAIQATMDEEHPDERIVGWYHTHPGFGIFLSGMDLFIQDHFFNLPWQVAFVYDPLGNDEGMFYWKQGKADRQPFLVEPDNLLLTSDHSNKTPAITLAELQAEEERLGIRPAAPPPIEFEPPTQPVSPDSKAGKWAGSQAAVPKKSNKAMWIVGMTVFVLSFVATMWAMFFNQDENVIVPPPHVDHAASQPKPKLVPSH